MVNTVNVRGRDISIFYRRGFADDCETFSIGVLLIRLVILFAGRNTYRAQVAHAVDAEIKRIMKPGARQRIVRGKNIGVERNVLHPENTM